MKRKSKFQSVFVGGCIVLSILLFSANSVFAQCGNYFRANYSANAAVFPGYFNLPGDMMLDDWTGDGKSDFWNLRRNTSSLLLDIVIYPSRPGGYWDWNNPIIYTTPVNNIGSYHEVADFDADGRADLAFGSSGFRILHTNVDGSMTALPIVTDSNTNTGSNATIGFVDLNNDNLLDWVYSGFFGSSPNLTSELRYRLQTTGGSFANPVTILASSAANGLLSSNKNVGDFNGDGKIDIIYSTASIGDTNKYVLIKNLGAGNFDVGTPVATDLYVYNQWFEQTRDYNNDGRADILSRSAIFHGRADGTFDRTPLSGIDGTMLPAELNGDNNLDVIEVSPTSYAAHISDGAGNFTRTVYPKNFATSFNMTFEDFSGDGKADLYYPGTTQTVNSNIFGEYVVTIRENICQTFGETNFADFDGNFGSDLMMWKPNSGAWASKNARWFPNVDPNTKVFNWGLGVHGDVPAPGDFDGDGKTDYAVYRNSTGNWYILKSSDSSWMVVPFGLAGDIAVPNDYDGGGKTDIAVWRPSDGIWYFWFSETQSFGALHFGASGDKPVPADFDGDNKTDMAVYRPSEGNWYYLRSSDLTYVVLHWGIATDIPLPADYDGDGKADVAIYRDGLWWIWRSSNNQYGVIQFGTAGDIPMPVYRNAISADLILYRPSNNLWFSYDNRIVPGVALGGSGDAPVRFGLPNN